MIIYIVNIINISTNYFWLFIVLSNFPLQTTKLKTLLTEINPIGR